MNARLRAAAAVLVAFGLGDALVANASGGSTGIQSPQTPQSSAGATIQLNQLLAGASGTYTPSGADTYTPTQIDPRNPTTVPPPPDPQGKTCPATTTFHIGHGGRIVSVVDIYPSFTRNAQGGYDGSDPNFGYAQPNAVPPGGDPTKTAIGAPVTAVTLPGHIVAVDAWLQRRGTWQDATPGIAPYGGRCVGFDFTFSAPFIVGDAPPPVPPSSVLNKPPFALGATLVSQLTGAWRIGTVRTMPGPQPTTTTYVHIPTCAWLDSGVPVAPVPLHAITTTVENGITLFLVYNLTVTPGTITWDWGDGTQSQSGPVESAPTSQPQYDPTSQTWSDPCDVSHAYATVAHGRTITASQSFTIAVTVSWFDGVAVHTQPVPCDAATGGPCDLTIGGANGWNSGPHPVSQIEPVPYVPPSPTP
jgi:hypothetical protein